MKIWRFAALAALATAGCSGAGETSFGFTGTNLSGTTYQGRGITAQSSSTSPSVDLVETDADLKFVPSFESGSGADAYSAATLSLDTEEFTLFSDTGSSASSFDNSDAIAFAPGLKGLAGLDDALIVTLISTSAFFTERVGFYVLGNQSSPSALPAASGTYTGRASIINGSSPLDISNGDFTAAVDFAGGALTSGAITMDQGTLSGTRLALAPASLSGSEFTTTLSSADTTVNSSYVEGRFFGPSGGELVGTMHMTTPSAVYVGAFAGLD